MNSLMLSKIRAFAKGLFTVIASMLTITVGMMTYAHCSYVSCSTPYRQLNTAHTVKRTA